MLIVFLQFVIKAIELEYVMMVITRLGYFFNFITQKVINEAELPALKKVHRRDSLPTWDVLPAIFLRYYTTPDDAHG